MSIKTWLKGWVMQDQLPPEKDDKTVVTESLMMELDCQIRERELEIKDEEEKKNETGVDYSWLVSKPQKHYELPQMERLELEEMCSHVLPEECTTVITLFREGILRKPQIQNIPRILRTIIRQVVETRPKEETITDKVKKNLKKAKPVSRIMPIDPEQSMTPVTPLGELPHKKCSSGTSYNSSNLSSQSTISMDRQTFFQKSLDDLPV